MVLQDRDTGVRVSAIQTAGVLRDETDRNHLTMQFCAGGPLDELHLERAQAALLEVAAQRAHGPAAARR